MGKGQLLLKTANKIDGDLYPCPRCGKPYAHTDPSQWRTDPPMCYACHDEVKPFRNTVVYVVGPDMCGKTEISRALARKLALPYYKASSEHGAFLKKQERFINDIRYACPARLDL